MKKSSLIPLIESFENFAIEHDLENRAFEIGRASFRTLVTIEVDDPYGQIALKIARQDVTYELDHHALRLKSGINDLPCVVTRVAIYVAGEPEEGLGETDWKWQAGHVLAFFDLEGRHVVEDIHFRPDVDEFLTQ